MQRVIEDLDTAVAILAQYEQLVLDDLMPNVVSVPNPDETYTKIKELFIRHNGFRAKVRRTKLTIVASGGDL